MILLDLISLERERDIIKLLDGSKVTNQLFYFPEKVAVSFKE